MGRRTWWDRWKKWVACLRGCMDSRRAVISTSGEFRKSPGQKINLEAVLMCQVQLFRLITKTPKEIGRSALLAWVRDHSLLLRCKGAHRLLRVHPSGVKRNRIRCLSLALSKDCPVKGASDRTGTGRSLAIQVHTNNQEAKGLFRKRLYWRLLTNKWGSNTQFNDSKKIVTDQYYSRCQGDSSE